MATETRKVLGQVSPGAALMTDLYTVPAATQTVVSTILVTNTGNTSTLMRMTVAIAGAADAPGQLIYDDVTIPGNDTLAITIGMTLAATDKIRCYNLAAQLNFTVFGIEIS